MYTLTDIMLYRRTIVSLMFFNTVLYSASDGWSFVMVQGGTDHVNGILRSSAATSSAYRTNTINKKFCVFALLVVIHCELVNITVELML